MPEDVIPAFDYPLTERALAATRDELDERVKAILAARQAEDDSGGGQGGGDSAGSGEPDDLDGQIEVGGDPLAQKVVEALALDRARTVLSKAEDAFEAAQLENPLEGDIGIDQAKRDLIGAQFDMSFAEMTVPYRDWTPEQMDAELRKRRLAAEDKRFEAADLQKSRGADSERFRIALEEQMVLQEQVEEFAQVGQLRKALALGEAQAAERATEAVRVKYLTADAEKIAQLQRDKAETWVVDQAKSDAENIPVARREGYQAALKAELKKAKDTFYRLHRSAHVESVMSGTNLVAPALEL